MRKRIVSLLIVAMLLGAVAAPALAHEVPDPGRRGSISIAMTYQGTAVPGGTLTLYRVAAVDTDNGDYFFTYTEDFSGCSIPVTELSSANIASELASIARQKNLSGTTCGMDEEGNVTFSDLELGLYLLVQEKAAPGFQKVNPFLVSVPYQENGHYIYDVDTAPKNLPDPETEPTTQPTKPSGNLPQTGQTHWPVPVMAVAGLLLIAAGFCLRLSGRKYHDEA